MNLLLVSCLLYFSPRSAYSSQKKGHWFGLRRSMQVTEDMDPMSTTMDLESTLPAEPESTMSSTSISSTISAAGTESMSTTGTSSTSMSTTSTTYRIIRDNGLNLGVSTTGTSSTTMATEGSTTMDSESSTTATSNAPTAELSTTSSSTTTTELSSESSTATSSTTSDTESESSTTDMSSTMEETDTASTTELSSTMEATDPETTDAVSTSMNSENDTVRGGKMTAESTEEFDVSVPRKLRMNMTPEIIAIAVVFVVCFLGLLWFFIGRKRRLSAEEEVERVVNVLSASKVTAMHKAEGAEAEDNDQTLPVRVEMPVPSDGDNNFQHVVLQEDGQQTR